jgi:hypothetical protein
VAADRDGRLLRHSAREEAGHRRGQRVALLDAPSDFIEMLEPVPLGVAFREDLRGTSEVVVCFVTSKAALARRVESLGRAVFPDGAAWVAWPKRASGVPTDMTEDVVRELALPLGLVDNKVAAIDETWSGLRIVWRRELRVGPKPGT